MVVCRMNPAMLALGVANPGLLPLVALDGLPNYGPPVRVAEAKVGPPSTGGAEELWVMAFCFAAVAGFLGIVLGYCAAT